MSIARRLGYKKSELSREQVLDAAISVFAKKGIASSSVQDIADAAKMSKGSIHYHFTSKDELLERVVDRCCDVLEARIRGVFETDGLPLERLHWALTELWVVRRDGTREMRVLTEMHVLARQNEDIRRACGEALLRAIRQMLETGLDDFLALGLRPKVSVELIPRMILATLDGLALQHEIAPVLPEAQDELIRALEAATLGLFEAVPAA